MTVSQRSDDELVDEARRGDRGAMDLLLRRHYPRVNAVCRRIAGSTRDADDAAQEAMIKVVRNIASFDGRSSFGTWVYRIAANAALDELRRRRRGPALHIVGESDEGPPEPTDVLAQRRVEAIADRMAIDSALAELSEEFKVPVVLRDVADLDYAEIATVLDIPIGTVKSRIARGRRILVDRLGNHDDPDRRPNGDPDDSPPSSRTANDDPTNDNR